MQRELERAVQSFAREGESLLAERLDAARRRRRRCGSRRSSRQVAAGLERQREEFVATLSSRLGEVEADFRERLAALAAEEEAERAALEARLGEIARRIEQTVSRAEERLGACTGRRVRPQTFRAGFDVMRTNLRPVSDMTQIVEHDSERAREGRELAASRPDRGGLSAPARGAARAQRGRPAQRRRARPHRAASRRPPPRSCSSRNIPTRVGMPFHPPPAVSVARDSRARPRRNGANFALAARVMGAREHVRPARHGVASRREGRGDRVRRPAGLLGRRRSTAASATGSRACRRSGSRAR